MSALPLAHHPGGEVGWQPAPLAIVAAAAAAFLFGRAFLRLRRRGRADLAPAWRAMAFATAIALGLLAVTSPLDAVGERQLVSAHMLQHVLLGDLVPALLVLALGGPLLWLAAPRAVLRAVHRRPRLRAAISFLLKPAVAFGIWAAAFAAWHVPALWEAALASQALHDLEHATFFVAGVLVWTQLLDPARRGALSPVARLGFAVCLLAAGGALVNVLVFGSPLYPSYLGAESRVVDLSPSADQQAAGMIMLVEQWLTVGAFAVAMLMRRSGGVFDAGRLPLAGDHPLSS